MCTVFFGSGWSSAIVFFTFLIQICKVWWIEWSMGKVRGWKHKSDTQQSKHCPFLHSLCHSFKSKVLSPVLSSCHTYFNYLTELQRQEREWVPNRCHFSSSPGGYEGCSKWLWVAFPGMSWGKTILRLLSPDPTPSSAILQMKGF